MSIEYIVVLKRRDANFKIDDEQQYSINTGI